MKKLIFLAVFFSFIPFMALATSGACSSHGGVNCSAGGDLFGKVICNDGWSNSAVYFSDTDECKTSCTPPPVVGCTNENDAGALSSQLARSGGYLGDSTSGTGAMVTCRTQITAYQTALQTYNSCLASKSANSSSSYNYGNVDSTVQAKMQDYCTKKSGPQSVYNSAKTICDCTPGYKIGKNSQCISYSAYCAERIGDNSYFSETDQFCICNSGYVVGDDGKCILGDSYCSSKYGENSWLNISTMRCEYCDQNGVRGKKENGQCVFPTITPTMNVAPTQQPAVTQKPIQTNAETKPKETPQATVFQKSTDSKITVPGNKNASSISSPQTKKQEPKKSWLKVIWSNFLGLFKK